MKSGCILYIIFSMVFLPFYIGGAQNDFAENKEALIKFFADSITTNIELDSNKVIDNTEAIFIKYYKGLELIDNVPDSLKLKFYDRYIAIMADTKLFDESNKLAKEGLLLLSSSPILSKSTDISYYYKQLAFNYLGLRKYDSVTWAFKKNIETNQAQGVPVQNVSAYNNLGYHYFLNIKNNDSALHYLRKSINSSESNIAFRGSLTLESSIKDNLGLVYINQRNFAAAGTLFKENFDYYKKTKRGYLWRERWFRAGLQYVDVEMKLENFSHAKTVLMEIENHINEIEDFSSSPIEYFPTKLLLLKTKKEYYRRVGNYQESDLYGESYLKLQDSVNIINNLKLSKDLNLIREIGLRNAKNTLRQEQEISIIEKKNLSLNLKRKSAKIYWGIAIGLLTLFIVAGYLYFKKIRRYDEKQNKMQKKYSQNLIKTQEVERKRVSRELHDSVGQKLMLLSKRTRNLGDFNTASLALTTLEEVRNISRGLHPANLTRLGLTMAINSLIYDINSSTDLFFTDEIENIDQLLAKDLELHLYRIIQETLTNIVKHSDAKAVKILIHNSAKTIKIHISDNGKGFDIKLKENNTGLGMKTLFERSKIINAQINLKSSIGRGTEIDLSIPINI